MAVSRPLLLLLLFVTVALAGNHNRHHRVKRDNDLHDWLTTEQKESLKDIQQGTEEFKKKVGEFYVLLPAEKRAEWDKFYKKHCFEWTAKAQNKDEETEFQKSLADNDVEKVRERIGELKKNLDEKERKNVEMWEEDCYKLVKPMRKRREIEAAFQDFVKWMTPEQVGDITALKAAGKDSEVQEKVKEYFGQLPADQQKTLREEFKGKCKVYFTPLMTSEELVKIETLKGDKEAAGTLMKGVVERQEEDVKAIAAKMLNVCGEVYKESSRNRREIEAAFKDFVKWMTPEQVGDITALKAAGKDSEVQEKVKEYFALLPNDQQATLKEEFKGKCKVYFTPLMTAEELEKIETLKGDREAAGALVTGVVDRQEGEVKAVAEKMFSVCGEVYKDSKRRRREIEAAFQDFVKWMTPDQLGDITALKEAGKESEVQEKVKEFFGQLPADQQKTLREEFKGKCKIYFTPLMTAEELDKIKTLKDDKEAAGALVKGVVDRQEGEVKAVAQKMLSVCGEVYKESSRKRREIEPAFQDFVKWMTPQQLGDITALKTSGKENEVQEKVKEFFGLLPADKQAALKEEFKGKCKVYFTPLMTSEELEKIQTLKANKEAAGALMKSVVDRQEGGVKAVAEKMLGVCGEVYKESSRKRREIEEAFKDFVKWMTPEQLGEIAALKTAGKETSELQAKTKEFFEQLPADQQKTLREEFKGKCKVYFTPLMTADELEKIKELKSTDKEAAGALVKGVVDRQIGDVKAISEKMLSVCGEVYKDTSRKRREIEAAFQDFVKWMTPEQLGDITALKTAGKDSEVTEKVKEYFALLPADQQKTLTEQFKGNCRTYFSPLMTADESEKIKAHVGSGDKDAAKDLVKGVVDRQTGEVKNVAEKMFGICGEVFKESKSKRDVSAKIDKHLGWLLPNEKEEILKMVEDGKSHKEIKGRLMEMADAKEHDPEEKTKTVKMCYAWMDDVATKEEIDSLHKLHHVDHGACKKKVREFIGRLPEERQRVVEASLPFCEKIWYGNHGDHSAHEEHGDHSGHEHHHRKRRHLAVIEKYIEWLDDKQKIAIDELESSGAEFSTISDKIKEFFYQLPQEKQTDVKDKFQHQCMIWAKEVSKPLEWEEIKKYHAAEDHTALKAKLIELEERLTENQKHTIEHVRGICYKLWGIKHVSRRVRVPNSESSFQEKAAKYLDWMNEEQLKELKRLKSEGKKSEVMKAILKFFDATTGEVKEKAEGKLKEACREYSVKAFGAEKVAQFKKLSDEKADKSEMEKLANQYVDEIEDEQKKDFAKAVVTGCKHIYASSRARRDLIAQEVAEYLQN